MANRRTKEKYVIDQLPDHIDLHGMTAEELAGENGLHKKLTSRFYSKVLEAEMDGHRSSTIRSYRCIRSE